MHPLAARPAGDATPHRPVLVALLALAALYLVQCVSPLRLESDAVDYLSTAAAMVDGRVLPKVPFPHGYPYIIATLDRLGLGSASFFVFANCVFLALGLWATWRIFSDYSACVRMWIVIATLLALSVVKSVAAPLPEAAFFGTSMLSLAAASTALSAAGPKRWGWFALSVAAAAFALSIRVVGVALIPTLLWAGWCAFSNAPHTTRPQRRVGVTIIVLLVLAAVALAFSRLSIIIGYLEHPAYWYVYGGLKSPVGGRAYGMLAGLGQMIVNLPLSRFHSLAPAFAAAGLAAMVLLVLGRRKPGRLTITGIYLGFYLGVLAFWPYDSPRLWMPVTPLIAAHVVITLDRARNKSAMRLLVPLYAAWFALTGIAALAYTTRISLSGSEFPRLYGTDGGMATTGLHTMGPKEMRRYNAQADTLLHRYRR
ncbi:MAG: hypothetical protein ABIU86_15115 [Gemmatimonadaceae bacterium]